MSQNWVVPDIPEEQQTTVVKALLALLEQVIDHNQKLSEEVEHLKDEINILKGEKKKPTFKPSKLDKSTDTSNKKKKGQRQKKSKTSSLIIHQDEVVPPRSPVPDGSRFKGYQDFIVQDISIQTHNTRYRLERWLTPEGKLLSGKLPENLKGRHFGAELLCYILYQYHHCHTTQPLLLEQLHEWGVEISSGQLNALLLDKQEAFHAEKDTLLKTGLSISPYISVDDSGARHQGKNGFVTQIGNDGFAWFGSTASKSRVNFFSLLRVGHDDCHLNSAALAYMEQQGLPEPVQKHLLSNGTQHFKTMACWTAHLDGHEVKNKTHRRIATEGVLLASALSHGLHQDLVILSDGAGQFNVLKHALCWVHTERLIHKMLPLNDQHRQDIEQVRGAVWNYYSRLKAFQADPDPKKAIQLWRDFDPIFTRKTTYQTLNLLLKRIYRKKSELLLVLERPEVPLHTNGSETDIRDFVKKKKISGGTRSDEGRRCRDTFASLKKTCRKQGISFWQYLQDRLGVKKYLTPDLSELLKQRAIAATGY